MSKQVPLGWDRIFKAGPPPTLTPKDSEIT